MPGTLIDMHLHTLHASSDSMLKPDDLVSEALDVGLTGVGITEHDRMWEQWDLAPFRKSHPEIFVANGMEVSTDHGHILAYGMNGYAPGIRSLKKLREVADSLGAFLIVAHPFRHYFDSVHVTRKGGERADKMTPEEAAELPVFSLVHGIEVLNGCNTARENYFALQVAKVLGKPGTGGSDAHSRQGVGYFSTRFEEELKSGEHLVEMLHAGRVRPVRGLAGGNPEDYWETARPPEDE